MSSVGGPGGIGGPKGPGGPEGAQGADDVADVGELGGDTVIDRTTGIAASDIDAIAGEIAAGRLTPHEAVEKLVDQIAGTDQLGATDRAELREMITDLVANDPYLASLVGRV
ncbi:MAG: hypothetical protein JWO36_3391 [Myxococcales bacterium]|nr:hypothetical protein [Myxococcales bacterium]